jgi:DNA-binding winged helix-turn-helix (wHTH) protein
MDILLSLVGSDSLIAHGVSIRTLRRANADKADHSVSIRTVQPRNGYAITTALRGDDVRRRGPASSSTTMSSIRMPVTPGR